MESKTHLRINEKYVGTIDTLSEGRACVNLLTLPEMAVDDRDLVHGGFTFGLADYAAMLAVNDPFVVLGAANVRFLAAVRVGETLRAEARLLNDPGRKKSVWVEVSTEKKVFEGEFACFILSRHVLG